MSASKTKLPSTSKSAPTTTNFSKGFNTYLPNDLLEYEQLRMANNVRFDKIGEYKTRTGIQPLDDPVGLTNGGGTGTPEGHTYHWEDVTGKQFNLGLFLLTSDDAIYSVTVWLRLKPREDGRRNYIIPRLKFCGRYSGSDSGSPMNNFCISCNKIEMYDDGELHEYRFIFPHGIDKSLINQFDDVYFEIDSQGPSQYSEIQAACTGNSGTTIYWEYDYAPRREIVGMFEANINGYEHLFYAVVVKLNGTPLELEFKVRQPNGTITTIDRIMWYEYFTNRVRFSQNMDEIRVACGWRRPLKITVTRSGGSFNYALEEIQTLDLQTGVDLEIRPSNILTGTQDNIIYFDADTNTQAVWTNPYGLQWAPGVDYTTTAALKEYSPGSTRTVTISTSTLEPTNADHPASSAAIGDIIVDENDNYGEIIAKTGQNITVKAISHVATPINSYDKFDRDFRQNFPSIKTGDPLTAMFNLGGIVYFMTRHHKYYMYSQTADVWTQQASPAQHGTFSQESVVCDLNYAYYACDDGIYVFNGSTESSITDKTIQDLYDRIPDKTSIHLQLYNNRLYVFWADTGNPAGWDKCDSCFVYNINLKVWESYDTHIPACVTIGRQSPSNRLLCGSNCFEQIFQYEIAPPPSDRAISNALEMYYADFGCAPIEAEIYTSFLHFGTPSQKHRITKWRPEFDKEPYPWYVKCGYSLDYDPMVRYAFSVNLSNGSIWSERPHNYPDWPWATNYERATITPTKLSTIPKVYGQFYRCQICYQHFAAFEPFSLKSHTLVCQTQRIR